MKIARHAFLLGAALFCLLLSPATARSQLPSSTYFFLEAKDNQGQPVADAQVKAFGTGERRPGVFTSGATNKDGILKTSIYVNSYPPEQYNVEISKPGYLPYEDIFFSWFHLLFYVPGRSDPSDSYLHNRVVMLREPATSTAERAAFEAQKRKYQFLLAAKRGDVATLRKLLQAGVEANAADAQGMTAITWAAYLGNAEAIKLLLDAGADVRNKEKPAHESLIAYLSNRKIGCRFSVPENEKAELAACDETARLLIKAGAGVNPRNPQIDPTLHMAFYHHYVSDETINMLIKAGANINAVDSEGTTPLMLAAYRGKMELAKTFLAAGVPVDARNKFGWTALIRAAYMSRLDMARLLIKAGANINAADEHGMTALMYTVDGTYSSPSSDLAVELIAAGAQVNAADENGRTTLMLAAEKTFHSTVKLLLAAGARINARDKEGRTALMYAVAGNGSSKSETVVLLLASGADVNIKDNAGKTALMIAREARQESVASLLEQAARPR